MANQRCIRSSQRRQRCVKCLSLVEELLKDGDLSEEEISRLSRIKKTLEKGSVISESQVNYIYDLWRRYS